MYNWIESTFNVSGGATQVIAAILALIAVLLLFSIFVFVLKRLTGANTPQNRSRQPRIAVMDSTNVDARRQLVLIRRDNVEHLLLVGGPSDLVVEQHIVRNAPVAAQRPATSMAAASAGSGAMKMPTAPGPDIPARPDEVSRQPVAAMVRQEPMPAVPLKARNDPAVRPAPKTAAANTMVRPVSPLKNQDKTPPVVAPVPPLAAKETQEFAAQTQDKEAGTRPDRAADLLRAATLNGFNRSKSAAPLDKEDATGEPAIDSVPNDKALPAISTGPKNTAQSETESALTVIEEPEASQASEPELEQTAPEGDIGASPPLKNLGRSIAARERSTQTAHTITPPSSGPAARAKTALLNPVQSPRPAEDSAHAVEEQNPADAAIVPAGPDVEGVKAQTDEANAEEEKLKLSDLFENTEKFDWVEDEPAEKQEADAVSKDGTADAEAAASEQPAAAPRREIELDLKFDDLIDGGAPTASASRFAMEDAPVAPAERPQDPEVQSKDSNRPTTTQSATLDIVPGAEPAAPRVVQGLGDKNPIEDEMAKILFELGGQQNR